MQKLKTLIISLVVALSGGAMLVPAISAADAFNGDACAGLNTLQSKNSTKCDASSGKTLNNIVKFAVDTLSVIVGITAVIMIVIAGFRFVTSGGDSNNVTSARNTILYAVIGLIIVGLAQVLVHFIIRGAAKSG